MESQETIVKSRNFNPRLIGGIDSIEFTFDYSTADGLETPAENIREFTTIGNKKKKQAEDDKYRFTLIWFEPTDNIPERLYLMRANAGDRTVTFTYVHSTTVIGRADLDGSSGGSLTVYIVDFKARRSGASGGKEHYRCALTLQEI